MDLKEEERDKSEKPYTVAALPAACFATFLTIQSSNPVTWEIFWAMILFAVSVPFGICLAFIIYLGEGAKMGCVANWVFILSQIAGIVGIGLVFKQVVDVSGWIFLISCILAFATFISCGLRWSRNENSTQNSGKRYIP